MTKDPTVAIRDCLAEIDILHQIADGKTLATFKNDPIARRAAAYAIQTVSEAVRHLRLDDAILWEVMTTDTHAPKTVMEAMLRRHTDEGV